MAKRKIKSAEKQKKQPKKKVDFATYTGRSLWNGYVTFGLVNIPVILVSVEKPSETLHFKLLDKKNLSPIQYQRINQETGKPVEWNDIVKGYEYEKGSYAILTDEDFESIETKNSKTINIEEFVDSKDINPLYFDKPYYLLPGKQGEKGYVLLRETLKQSKKVGIAKVMIRTHQYLAAIIPVHDALIVNTLRYPDEIKLPAEMHLPSASTGESMISKKEFEIAQQLVQAMATQWNPNRHTNTYRDEVLEIIDKKVKQGKKGTVKHAKAPSVKKTNVIDFMDLLKKSVNQKKGSASR